MRGIFRSILFYSVSLFVLTLWIPEVRVVGGIQTFFIAATILTAMNLILKPVLHIVALPVTILTLGLFSFVINAGILFLMTKFVPGVSIHAFTLQAYAYKNFTTPRLSLTIPFAFIFVSFVLSLLVTILRWITKD